MLTTYPSRKIIISIQDIDEFNSCVVFDNFFAKKVFFEDNFQGRHAGTKMFLRTSPEISRRNFWCNKKFQKKFTGSYTGCKPEILIFWCGLHISKSP